MGYNSVAEEFYKIASMHDDVPEVSKILAVLASQPKNNPKTIAQNFGFMALSGYDNEPYKCFELANIVLETLQHSQISTKNITQIEQLEKNLIPPE